MNAEQFHDALTLLSPDLVAEAEEIRQRSKAPRRWKPLAAMAACFLLVLGMGAFQLFVPGYRSAAPETAMNMAEAAPEEAAQVEAAPVENAASSSLDIAMDAAAPFWEARTVSTPESATSNVNRSTQPKLTLVTCEEDWNAYCAAATGEVEALDQAVDLSRLAEKDLLLIELPAQTAEVSDVIDSGKGWQVCLTAPTESTGSTIALWLQKGTVSTVEEIALSWPEE